MPGAPCLHPARQNVGCATIFLAVAVSQNCVFGGGDLSTSDNQPRGLELLECLGRFLAGKEWRVGESSLWRDCGWSLPAQREYSRLTVVLSAIHETDVLIQVAPEAVPGFLGRLIGRKQSAPLEDVQQLANAVHRFLILEGLEEQRWCWDGYPTEGTWEPVAPGAIASLPVRPRRPISPHERAVIRRVFELAPRRGEFIDAFRSLDSLDVIARCACGCASVEFGASRDEAPQEIIGDAIGEFEDGALMGVMVWGHRSAVTGLEVHPLGDMEHGAVSLPQPSTLRRFDDGEAE